MPGTEQHVFSHHLGSLRSIAAYGSSGVPKRILPHLLLLVLGAYKSSLPGACNACLCCYTAWQAQKKGKITVDLKAVNSVTCLLTYT